MGRAPHALFLHQSAKRQINKVLRSRAGGRRWIISNGVMLTKDGKTQSIARWAEELGLSEKAIRNRLKRGMTEQEALSEKWYSGGRRPSTGHLQLTEGCCLPDCLNCPLPECNYNGRPTREETQKTKEALKKLPDSPAAYSHTHKIPWITGKKW